MGATPPQADIQPFEQAKLSLTLTQVIAKAKDQRQGKTLEARFEVWHGKPVYFIRTSAANQLWEGRIDANTGDLVGRPCTRSSRVRSLPRQQWPVSGCPGQRQNRTIDVKVWNDQADPVACGPHGSGGPVDCGSASPQLGRSRACFQRWK